MTQSAHVALCIALRIRRNTCAPGRRANRDTSRCRCAVNSRQCVLCAHLCAPRRRTCWRLGCAPTAPSAPAAAPGGTASPRDRIPPADSKSARQSTWCGHELDEQASEAGRQDLQATHVGNTATLLPWTHWIASAASHVNCSGLTVHGAPGTSSSNCTEQHVFTYCLDYVFLGWVSPRS